MIHTPTRGTLACLATSALLVTLAACGGGGGGGTAPGGEGSKGGGGRTNTLTIWYRPGSLPTKSITDAQAAFPDTKLDFVKTADVDTKLTAALRVKKGLPDITTGDPISLSGVESRFVDAKANGLGDAAGAYLPWKLKSGEVNGHQVGIPIDIGPLAIYYDADVFKTLGLPTDPAEVGKAVSTWDGYRQLATKVKAGGKFACDDIGYVYYFDILSKSFTYYQDGAYNPDGQIGKDAYTQALAWRRDGLCANTQLYTTDWSSAVSRGSLVAFLGPTWIGGVSLQSAAPKQSGQWRVATLTPDGYAAEDGSLLMMPKTDADPALQVKVATWLTSAANQSAGYAKDGLFPSTPDSYKSPELSKGLPYYDNQATGLVLGDIATKAPVLVRGKNTGPVSELFSTTIRETKAGVSPDDAYAAALARVKTQFPQ